MLLNGDVVVVRVYPINLCLHQNHQHWLPIPRDDSALCGKHPAYASIDDQRFGQFVKGEILENHEPGLYW